MGLTTVHASVAGSYISASGVYEPGANPPSTSTRPSASVVALKEYRTSESPFDVGVHAPTPETAAAGAAPAAARHTLPASISDATNAVNLRLISSPPSVNGSRQPPEQPTPCNSWTCQHPLRITGTPPFLRRQAQTPSP